MKCLCLKDILCIDGIVDEKCVHDVGNFFVVESEGEFWSCSKDLPDNEDEPTFMPAKGWMVRMIKNERSLSEKIEDREREDNLPWYDIPEVVDYRCRADFTGRGYEGMEGAFDPGYNVADFRL